MLEYNAPDGALLTCACPCAQWHPDKNPGQTELASARFKEVQAAYATLSDPQERAWYDLHREVIMQGAGPREETGAGREEEPGVSLWPFFSAECYSGFGDESGGFYRVCAARLDEPSPPAPKPEPKPKTPDPKRARSTRLGHTRACARARARACAEHGARTCTRRYAAIFAELDHEEHTGSSDGAAAAMACAPGFGGADTSWREVELFYRHWEAFSTRRKCSFADTSDPSQARRPGTSPWHLALASRPGTWPYYACTARHTA